MTRDNLAGRQLLQVLVGGFTLLFLLLVASGFVAVDSMRSIESDAERLAAEQQATARLIDEVQSEEGNLSSVFYYIAAGRKGADRGILLQRLDALEAAIRKTTEAGKQSRDSVLWNKVQRAADAFIAEGRHTIVSNEPPPEDFYRRHENLIDGLAELTASNFAVSNAVQTRQMERASSRIRYALVLLAIGIVVSIAGALTTVFMVNRMFRQLRWQTSELTHLSSRVMSDQEETARRLSREMHDHFGQVLSAIEANLVAMQHARAFHPGRLDDCLALLKDAVDNVRQVSQLLRPSILDDFGLDASLRWLAEGFSERTAIPVHYKSSFEGRLSDERETQIFRIAQEALTNVARHAQASEVHLELTTKGDELRLLISDNGKGLPSGDDRRGTGLVGMRARARAAGGGVNLESKPGQGVSIIVRLPVKQPDHVTEDSNSFSR